MNKISSLLNFIICSASICVFAFIFFISITKKQVLSVVLTLLFFFLFSLFYLFIKSKKDNKSNKTKEQLQNIEKLKIWLLTSNQNDVWNLLKKAFDIKGELLIDNAPYNKEHTPYNNKDASLRDSKDSTPHHIKDSNSIDGKEISLLCFYGEKLTQKEFYSLLQKGYKYNNYFCIAVDDDILSKRAQLNDKAINFYDINAIFDKFTKHNCLPNLENFALPKRKSLKEIFSVALKRQKLFGYALLSLTFLFLSFFTPYKIYYRIVAIIILAIFVGIFFVKEVEN